MSARLSTLNFEYVRREHIGKYVCRVRNRAGQAQTSAELQINGYYLDDWHYLIILNKS